MSPRDTPCVLTSTALTSTAQSHQARHGAGACVIYLLPRRYGCHPKKLGGSREGATRLETLALHVCIPAGSGSWDPSVGSSVPRALVVAAGGEPSPGPRPPWRGERQGPRSCTLVCVHPRPRPAPGCVHTHADACTHTPACTGAVPAAAVPAVGAALPLHLANELPRCGDFFFFFRCLVHWFSSQTPHGSGFVFAGVFSSPFPGIPPELEKGTMAAALPPAPGLFGVGWQPAGCWIKEPQRNTGG